MIDSGPSNHITNNIQDFSEYYKFTNSGLVQTADKSSKIQICGEGYIYMLTKIDGFTLSIVMAEKEQD